MEVSVAFFKMRDAAAIEGINLHPFSAFRDFSSQLKIWNNKYTGKRPLYSKDGEVKNNAELTEKEIVYSILEWSALPGASRHHWGTEIDVIDTNSISEDYKVQLLPSEFDENGVFRKLGLWLDQNLEQFGFFRPYRFFQGGINTEPWHISYKPIAEKAMSELTIDLVGETLIRNEIMGKEVVLQDLTDIYEQYVINICE